jgi:hypothetical protein
VDGLAVTVLLPAGAGAGETPHAALVTVLVSSVTAASRARSLPATVALVVAVMLVAARIFPLNVVLVPRVAELPTCQYTLQGWSPNAPENTTDEAEAVVNVLGILNTHTLLPVELSVSTPVIAAVEAKQ